MDFWSSEVSGRQEEKHTRARTLQRIAVGCPQLGELSRYDSGRASGGRNGCGSVWEGVGRRATRGRWSGGDVTGGASSSGGGRNGDGNPSNEPICAQRLHYRSAFFRPCRRWPALKRCIEKFLGCSEATDCDSSSDARDRKSGWGAVHLMRREQSSQQHPASALAFASFPVPAFQPSQHRSKTET